MDTNIAYYHSPVGILEIKTSGEHLESLYFVNSWKGPKLEENEISSAADLSPVTEMCIQQLKEYFEGNRKNFTLQLQQKGTDFQQTVWKELCNIEYGKTISYLELSKRIGNTKAIRAVGTANGSNNISIIVPCHRVIGSNGDLVGYGGDLWRKKWLLDHENKFGNGVQVQTLF